ncbi:hypothetical protein M406DRAFT_346436 [Cryphonectria parasitica EP155]|uniref:Uncharacterized protein n=1 Tax=Cryphonectria parasitica (strain ATCC 38755 / EP155) TaxID=660469 RepID=A0A9P5CNP2_CRYP1|nr:uncharacterized protein M406DRAFT_346436 [Cryphonectria parasitica EP155]KAF3764135.1 hypothetical protein M406DRAFT_346436 [Cryphonectria parasitica EP155]
MCDHRTYHGTTTNSRLHLMAPTRVILAAVSSFGVGAALGFSQGSRMAGLQFRAEHAHKLPTTPTGWFMYHKSKNYNMARASVREAVRMGAKVSFWTTAMFSIENLYDNYRQSNDFVNTVLASLTVAGGFSVWNRFSLAMTARTTKTALVVGLVYGGMQDVMGAARGRHIGYIDWFRRRFGSVAEGKETTAP